MKYDPNLAERLNREAELDKERKPKVIIVEEKQPITIDSNIIPNQYILLDENTR